MDQSKREEATQLANRIFLSMESPDTELLLREMRKFEIVTDVSQVHSNDQDDDTVGIWTLNKMNQVFERNTKFYRDWSLWSKVHQIPKRKIRAHRIVLLGESVARGYFYDPFFTPAMVLAETLNDPAVGMDVEVVDLAKTDLNLAGLLNLGRQCMQLAPDTVMVFAGNNFLSDLHAEWHGSKMHDKETFEPIVSSFASTGRFSSFRDRFEMEVRNLTNRLIDFFTNISLEKKVNVLFVIPEFNLSDWTITDTGKPLPNLAGGELRDWVQARNAAVTQFKNRDLTEAENVTKRLIQLDPTHPAGYEILAQIKLTLNDVIEARRYFEMALDTSFRSFGRARRFSVIRNTILERSKDTKTLGVIDLAQIFKEHIPGRKEFLDYCHLTTSGIQVSMAHVAHYMLSQVFDKNVRIKGLLKIAASRNPDSRTISRAHFFAAIHNAHYGQSYDIVHHHCAKSLEASADVSKLMELYLDLASRKTSNELCRSFEEIMLQVNEQRYPSGFVHPRESKLLDLKLCEAITTSMESKGIRINTDVARLRKEEHGVEKQTVSLLQSFYCKTDYDVRIGKILPYFQAFSEKSEFYLVTGGKVEVECQITLKSRHCEKGDKLTVDVNGVPVAQIDITNVWNTSIFKISVDNLTDGTNSITLVWPIAGKNERVFSMRKVNRFSDVFDLINFEVGEIYTFTARVC